MLIEGVIKKDVEVLFIDLNEVEVIKLFVNIYLVMCVVFFNELDSYVIVGGMDVWQIIDGVLFDLWIGGYYNNLLFGYGGYCLFKDIKQLLVNYNYVLQNLICVIVDVNCMCKDFLVDQVLMKGFKVVGVYCFVMKVGFDNFCQLLI